LTGGEKSVFLITVPEPTSASIPAAAPPGCCCTGVAKAMGEGLTGRIGASSVWMLTGVSILLAILLSEATSNTASANMVEKKGSGIDSANTLTMTSSSPAAPRAAKGAARRCSRVLFAHSSRLSSLRSLRKHLPTSHSRVSQASTQ